MSHCLSYYRNNNALEKTHYSKIVICFAANTSVRIAVIENESTATDQLSVHAPVLWYNKKNKPSTRQSNNSSNV